MRYHKERGCWMENFLINLQYWVFFLNFNLNFKGDAEKGYGKGQ